MPGTQDRGLAHPPRALVTRPKARPGGGAAGSLLRPSRPDLVRLEQGLRVGVGSVRRVTRARPFNAGDGVRLNSSY